MAPGLASTLFLLGLVCTSALQVDQSMTQVEQPSWALEGQGLDTKTSCVGSKHSFDAGFGGCKKYMPNHRMHQFCNRDFDEKQGYYAMQVCDECNRCNSGAKRLNHIVKSFGDPHMQNILGQRFDLMRPGDHTLVQIPKHRGNRETLLRVVAQVSRVGASCQDMYIMKVNVTGAWLEKARRHHLHFAAGVAQPKLDSKWLHFGPVDLKVAQGKTQDGKVYLNFLVRNLAKVSYPIGGLLGEDSHDLEATPTQSCRRTMSLLEVSASLEAHPPSEGDEETTRSVAAAL